MTHCESLEVYGSQLRLAKKGAITEAESSKLVETVSIPIDHAVAFGLLGLRPQPTVLQIRTGSIVVVGELAVVAGSRERGGRHQTWRKDISRAPRLINREVDILPPSVLLKADHTEAFGQEGSPGNVLQFARSLAWAGTEAAADSPAREETRQLTAREGMLIVGEDAREA